MSVSGGGRTPSIRRWRFGNLPLSWKLLFPSVGVIVVLGLVGGFFIIRDLSLRSQSALDLEVTRRSVDAASVIRAHELSLIEAVNFAANLEGIANATRSRDRPAAARLMQSVVAVKSDLHVLAVTDEAGHAIAQFSRAAAGAQPRQTAGTRWEDQPFVRMALGDATGRKEVGFAQVESRMLLTIAAPVCAGTNECAPVGVAIAGVGVEGVAADALHRLGSTSRAGGGLTVFDLEGRIIASTGTAAPIRVAAGSLRSERVNERLSGTSVTTLYTPFEAGGHRLGTLAVSIPVGPTLAAVHRTAFGLGMILLGAMAGVALIGFLLSRLILRQVRSLVVTNRALGSGDLSARAQVHWHDEIGEVGTRLNEMAEQLQAMYDTLESRVAERTEEVERLLHERTEFFASISHELRTPLAVILRHAEMLLDDAYRNKGRWRQDAGAALMNSGGQLSRLIDDILELAEVEAGGLDLDLRPTDLRALLTEMRNTIEPLARAAGVRARLRLPRERLPSVLADPRRLRQIVLNLADNAVKYTPSGGSIEVVVESRPELVEVSVSDTGVGIPDEAGDRIFEPFFRVKGIETQRGQASSGLGLAVTRRLVEAHGGAITYSSAPGEGTTFTFSLLRSDDRPASVGSNGHEHHDAEVL